VRFDQNRLRALIERLPISRIPLGHIHKLVLRQIGGVHVASGARGGSGHRRVGIRTGVQIRTRGARGCRRFVAFVVVVRFTDFFAIGTWRNRLE
jgi:hypothetical protein